MIICKEDDSSSEGQNTEKAFCFGECSMGEPHDDFSLWFQQRYCGQPSMIEKLMARGQTLEHNWKLLAELDILAIELAHETMEHKDYVDWNTMKQWLQSHVGKHISTENW